MLVLGLTGSIGMGKSTAARMLARLGVPVHDADAAVHRLLGPGGAAVAEVAAAFPGVAKDGAVDREVLAKRVFGSDEALWRLENLLHPLVEDDQIHFIETRARRRAPVCVLDVPLLYETKGDELCDMVIVVSAPRLIQRKRVLARPNMTPERLDDILSRQVPDAEKRARADFVVSTGLGYREALNQLKDIVEYAKWLNARLRS